MATIVTCYLCLCREKNLSLSLVLLLACYSAVLVPAYLPAQQPIWSEKLTEKSMVQGLLQKTFFN